ncbi:MAG: DUF2865 domain-containing protein [Rhizobiaceae bacterium]|nr:DUF2865 domain-containing protein [Rhizobiaceae bacterium]MCV0408215.1 DUF2865 domain-containing protein [Rhizobiaceae bacterium]
MSGLGRVLAVAAMLAILLPGMAATASAASALCRQLEAQLVQAGRSGGAMSRKYAAAARTQEAHLRRARDNARRAGCGPFSGRACAELGATIRRMERNLAELQRQAAGGAPSRAAVLARLDANGCRDRPPARQARREREPVVSSVRQGLEEGSVRRVAPPLGDRSGRGERNRRPAPSLEIRGNHVVVRPSGPNGLGGSFRTMCVRTCDGYYFPMSHSSTPDDFDRDRAGCRSMCPGAETRLYAHRLDQESNTMISVDEGQPYAALPTAFAYKDASFTAPQGCSCRSSSRNFAIIAGEARQPAEPAQKMLPLPSARPDPGLDPDAAYDAATGLDAATIRRMLTDKPLAGAGPDERAVRVVGPAFLPDQEEAIDLRAPAPTDAQ